MCSYFVAASSKEATNTSVPSWSGRRNFNRSETSEDEHQINYELWFIACYSQAICTRCEYVLYSSVCFLLPPAHISKVFVAKSSPVTPGAKKRQSDIKLTQLSGA